MQIGRLCSAPKNAVPPHLLAEPAASARGLRIFDSPTISHGGKMPLLPGLPLRLPKEEGILPLSSCGSVGPPHKGWKASPFPLDAK